VDEAEQPTARLDRSLWEALLEPNPAPMAVYEPTTFTVMAVNAAGRALYGFDRKTCEGMRLLDLYPPDDLDERVGELTSGSEEVLGRPRIVRHRRADGSLAEMQVVSRPAVWEGREARVVAMTDVTHLRRVEAELAIEAARLHKVVTLQAALADAGPDVDRSLELVATGIAEMVEAANSSIWWAAGDALVVRANAGSPPTYEVGHTVPVSGTLAGECFASGQHVYVEDTAAYSDYSRELAATTGIGCLVLVPLVHNGEALGVLGVSAPVPRAFSAAALETLRLVAGLAGAAIQRAEVTDRLAYAATHDSLTGLSNRVHFTERLEHAIALGRRHRTPVGLLYLDLDGFKAVNDGFGHHAGDQVLAEVAARIRAAVREVDTVARLGGDEFAVVLSDVSGAAELSCAAGRIAAALEPPVPVPGGQVRVTASIGTALAGPGDAPGDVLALADAEMYREKANRR